MSTSIARRIEVYDGAGEQYRPVTDGDVGTAAAWAVGDGDCLPGGWSVCGRGRHRTLLRSAGGQYLKVATSGSNYPTYREVINWGKLVTAGWKVPAHTLYRAHIGGEVVAVLDVEYVADDGTEGDVAGALMALADLGAVDINPGNIVVREGEPAIIDAGGVE